MTGTPTANWGFPTYDGTEPGSLKTIANAQANAAEAAMDNASKGFYLQYDTLTNLKAAPTTSFRIGQHATVYADPSPVNDGDYVWNGSAWALANANPAIMVRRSSTGVSGGSGVWQQLTTAGWWSQDYNNGFTAFNGTIVAPVTGWYRLFIGMSFSSAPGTVVLMVTKNNSSANETGNILRQAASVASGELGVYASKLVKLSSGDVLRLQVFPSGSWTWGTDPDDGIFALELAYV